MIKCVKSTQAIPWLNTPWGLFPPARSENNISGCKIQGNIIGAVDKRRHLVGNGDQFDCPGPEIDLHNSHFDFLAKLEWAVFDKTILLGAFLSINIFFVPFNLLCTVTFSVLPVKQSDIFGSDHPFDKVFFQLNKDTKVCDRGDDRIHFVSVVLAQKQ